MGKWCKVKCDCSNRKPLPGSDWWDYSEYQKYVEKPQLAKSLEEWEEKVKEMYECGHRDGALIQLWQGGILKIGLALESAFKDDRNQFEIFRRISDWRNYDDEYLAISAEDVVLWQLEIDQFKKFMSGGEFLG